MYNGIGLPTPRGSGTNGYVQRNWAFVRKTKDKSNYKTEEDIEKLDASNNKQPNREILDHERKRKVEVKCMELEEILEDQGYSPSEIESKVAAYRSLLVDGGSKATAPPRDEFGRIIVRETHQIAEAQQEKNAKLREAFGISEYFVEGSSLDPQRHVKEAQAKAAAEQNKKYTLVHTPTPSPTHSDSEQAEKAKRKKKRPRERSSSPEGKKEKKKKSKKHKKDRSESPKHSKKKTSSKDKKRERRKRPSNSSCAASSPVATDDSDSENVSSEEETKHQKKKEKSKHQKKTEKRSTASEKKSAKDSAKKQALVADSSDSDEEQARHATQNSSNHSRHRDSSSSPVKSTARLDHSKNQNLAKEISTSKDHHKKSIRKSQSPSVERNRRKTFKNVGNTKNHSEKCDDKSINNSGKDALKSRHTDKSRSVSRSSSYDKYDRKHKDLRSHSYDKHENIVQSGSRDIRKDENRRVDISKDDSYDKLEYRKNNYTRESKMQNTSKSHSDNSHRHSRHSGSRERIHKKMVDNKDEVHKRSGSGNRSISKERISASRKRRRQSSSTSQERRHNSMSREHNRKRRSTSAHHSRHKDVESRERSHEKHSPTRDISRRKGSASREYSRHKHSTQGDRSYHRSSTSRDRSHHRGSTSRDQSRHRDSTSRDRSHREHSATRDHRLLKRSISNDLSHQRCTTSREHTPDRQRSSVSSRDYNSKSSKHIKRDSKHHSDRNVDKSDVYKNYGNVKKTRKSRSLSQEQDTQAANKARKHEERGSKKYIESQVHTLSAEGHKKKRNVSTDDVGIEKSKSKGLRNPRERSKSSSSSEERNFASGKYIAPISKTMDRSKGNEMGHNLRNVKSSYKLGSEHSDSETDIHEKKVLSKEDTKQKLLRKKDSTSSEDSSATSGSSSPVSKKARHEVYKYNNASRSSSEKHSLKSNIYKVSNSNSENIRQIINKHSISPDTSNLKHRSNDRSPVIKYKQDKNTNKYTNFSHSESRSRSSSASKTCVDKNNHTSESSSQSKLPKICSESKSYSSKDHVSKNTSSYKSSQPNEHEILQSKSRKRTSRSRSRTPANNSSKKICESSSLSENSHVQRHISQTNESKLYNTTKILSPSHKDNYRKNTDKKSNTAHLVKSQKNSSPGRKEQNNNRSRSQLNRSSSESSSLSYSPIHKNPERYRDILGNSSPNNTRSKLKHSSKSHSYSKHHKSLPSVMPRVRLRSTSEEDGDDIEEERESKKNFEGSKERDSEEEMETLKLLKSGLAVKAKESLGKKIHRAHSNLNRNISSVNVNSTSGLQTNLVASEYKNKSVEGKSEPDVNFVHGIELPRNNVPDDSPTLENKSFCENIPSDSCEPISTKHSASSSKSKLSTSPHSSKQITDASKEIKHCTPVVSEHCTPVVSEALILTTLTQMPACPGESKIVSPVIPSDSKACYAESGTHKPSANKPSPPLIQQSDSLTVSMFSTPPQEFQSPDISEESKLPVVTVEILTIPDTEPLVPESIPKPPGSPPNQILGNTADVELNTQDSKRRRTLKRSRTRQQKKGKKAGRNTDSSSSSRSRSRECEETSPKSHKSHTSSRSSHSEPSSRHASWSSSSSSRSKSPSRSRSRSPTRSQTRSPTRSPTHSRSQSLSSNSSRSSRSASHSSHSSSDSSRSRSPSIPRRKGSPSFLDRRRITRHRSSRKSSSSEDSSVRSSGSRDSSRSCPRSKRRLHK